MVPLTVQAICKHWLLYVKNQEEKTLLRKAVSTFIKRMSADAEVMGRVFLVLIHAQDSELAHKILFECERFKRAPATSPEYIQFLVQTVAHMRQGWESEGYSPGSDFSDKIFQEVYSRAVLGFASKLGHLPASVKKLLNKKLHHFGCGCPLCNLVVLAELRALQVSTQHQYQFCHTHSV